MNLGFARGVVLSGLLVLTLAPVSLAQLSPADQAELLKDVTPTTQPAASTGRNNPEREFQSAVRRLKVDGLTRNIYDFFQAINQAYANATSYQDTFVMRIQNQIYRGDKLSDRVIIIEGRAVRVLPDRIFVSTAVPVAGAERQLISDGARLAIHDVAAKKFQSGVAPRSLIEMTNISPAVVEYLSNTSQHIQLLLGRDAATVLLKDFTHVEMGEPALITVRGPAGAEEVRCNVVLATHRQQEVTATIYVDENTNFIRRVSTDLTRLGQKQVGQAGEENVLVKALKIELDVINIETNKDIADSEFVFDPQKVGAAGESLPAPLPRPAAPDIADLLELNQMPDEQ